DIAFETLQAMREGVELPVAARDYENYPALSTFHQGVRDALFVELPREFEPWTAALSGEGQLPVGMNNLQVQLVEMAQQLDTRGDERLALQSALAELLVFESVRLQLLIVALGNESYEMVGGEEEDVDRIAWEEVQALLAHIDPHDPELRPVHVMFASANISLHRDAASRAEALRYTGSDFREELAMHGRLRAALRRLRLPESVLLENALANLLGTQRQELMDLQVQRPVALAGLSRQAMDQRVSRGRRALGSGQQAWPTRRRPALFDLLRPQGPSES
ncbi:MAG: hypothetical protein ACPG77_12765, partial [Nannocystaceae bacterium]